MKKLLLMLSVLAFLAVNVQAVNIGVHEFTLKNWGDATLSNYVQSYFDNELNCNKTYTYLGRAEGGDGSFSYTGTDGQVDVQVNGLGNTSGTWGYSNSNGPDLDVVAIVMKGGKQGYLYWAYAGDNPCDIRTFAADANNPWVMQNDKGLSFFAAFSDPPRSVPEGGSLLGTMVAALFGLGLWRKQSLV